MRRTLSSALLIAIGLTLSACRAAEQPAPPADPPPAPTPQPAARWTAGRPVTAGAMFVVKRGNRCKIAFKYPGRVRAAQGDVLEFEVYNSCDRLVTVTVEPAAIEADQGNQSRKPNPFTQITPATDIPEDEFGVVKLTVDPSLGPPPGTTPPDKWKFKWNVNNTNGNDPELEVEY